MASIQETLAAALQHHQTGHLPEAAQLYQEILRQQPNQIDALQLLGIIAAGSSNIELAIECFRKAVEENPSVPSFHYNLGNALREKGQQAAAISHYQQALILQPNYVEAHNNLGLALEKQGKFEDAIAHYQQAITLQPNQAELYHNLGNALKNQGRLEAAVTAHKQAITLKPNCAEFHHSLAGTLQEKHLLEEAIAHYRQAITLQPNCAEFHNNLANALKKKNNLGEAIFYYQQALTLKPNSAEIHYNLGNVLREQGQLELAINHYQQTLALNPNSPETHHMLGGVLLDQGQLPAAISHYQQALTLKPNYVEAHNNLGAALHWQGQLPAAITHYQQALTLDTDYPKAHYNLSIALLLNGDFRRGFAEYEWRWQTGDIPARSFSQSLWDGSSLDGKTILLYGEQGFGDQIQFIRYVPLLSQYKGRIVVECSRELVSLFKTVAGINQLVAIGEALPTFDVHAPLMSLPRILSTAVETIPAQIPYLDSPTSTPLVLQTPPNTRLKVGIVWSGSLLYRRNRNRSCSLNDFLKLLDVPNIAFYSLQKEPQVKELSQLSPQLSIQDLSTQLSDFADTALVLKQLDLVICVDTAVAHLAGALGKPTWVLLSFVPDWRWMLEGDDSPWYPTMRLFRQSQLGDWAGVFERVKQALHIAVLS